MVQQIITKIVFFFVMFTSGVFITEASAQEIFEKEVNLKSNQAVSLDLDFAGDIVVKTWDKQKLYIKVVVKHNFKEKLDFQLLENNESNELTIEEKVKNLEKRKNISISSDDDDKNCINLNIDYEIYLPANVELSVKTISGDIDVKNMKNALKLVTISGFVDVSLNAKGKYNLKSSTISGEIFTDLKFDEEVDIKQDIVGSKINTTLNGGGKRIELKSISGDLFIRKRK